MARLRNRLFMAVIPDRVGDEQRTRYVPDRFGEPPAYPLLPYNRRDRDGRTGTWQGGRQARGGVQTPGGGASPWRGPTRRKRWTQRT
jgi:hypothetical protein